MAGEQKGQEKGREFRLEGTGLAVAGAVILAALVGAFYLGRWVERSSAPPVDALEAFGNPVGNVEQGEENVGEGMDFFDKAEGNRKAEPGREVPSPAPESSSEKTPAAVEAPGGPYYVQVFAGRDRASAKIVVRELAGKGYPVHLHAEREGKGALYKVRVGGFPDHDQAAQTKEKLLRDGYNGAWVTQVKGADR